MNIKDIAKICGVSPSTVSKILNNKDENISTETRKKVLAVTKEYQFTPYSKVLKNAMPKSNLIGVLVSDEEEGAAAVVYEIEKAASENGYSIILCNTQGDPKKAEKYLHVLDYKGADGLILLMQDEETGEMITVPAAAVHKKRVKTKNEKAADVYYEEQEAGYEAVKYLIEKGHKRIGCILLEKDGAIEDGYRKAQQEIGLVPNLTYVFKGASIEEIMQVGISQCLGTDITSVICSSPDIACCIYERLRERGSLVPQDISVISVRDKDLSDILLPKLTAVSVPAAEIAHNAVDILVGILEGRKNPHDSRKKLKPRIKERESVCPPARNQQGGKIVVVGSMNMDCMISVPHIPVDGSTIVSDNLILLPGGKGANQAVGVGKLEGLVYMIGRLGNDGDGKEIYNNLVNSGVKMDGVEFDRTFPTGKAYVNVSPEGESTIVVYRGANARLDRNQIGRCKQLLEGARYCLISLEIAEDAVEYTVKECVKRGVQVILKPSAVESIRDSLYRMTDYFIPNEKELNQLAPGDMSVQEKADILIEKGVKNVIVTLGENGCYLRNAGYARFFPSADFIPVDTTGAADAFISALAVFLSEGYDIVYAIGFATYAAGISVTRYGAQAAMTDRLGLDIYKDEIRGIFGL